MTTIGTAGSDGLRKRPAYGVRGPSRIALIATLLGGLALGGCETTTGLFGGDSCTPVAQSTAPPAASKARVAIAQVNGAPASVRDQFAASFGEALRRQNVTVSANPSDPVNYTVLGYVVAAKEKTGIKVSYIWDVTDASKKRVNRITGEETVPPGATADPWSAVTPQLVQTITSRAAGSFMTWLPTAGIPAAAPATPVAAVPPPPAGKPMAPPPVASAAPVASTPTGSIGSVMAAVLAVVGAPGDGATSLTRALQQELARAGVATSDRPQPTAYLIEGRVNVGPPANGKQAIQIDWTVKDAQGNKVGSVSQKNEIPQGSLDAAWGPTADAAAQAAAEGILKLLPKRTASN